MGMQSVFAPAILLLNKLKYAWKFVVIGVLLALTLFFVAERVNHIYDNIPIIMVTIETTLSQLSLALKAGANEYLMKPFTKEMFLDKLNLLGILHN